MQENCEENQSNEGSCEMKLKVMFCAVCGLFWGTSVFAENTLSFSSVTDFAYYTKSDFVAGNGGFAPITGPYDGVEMRETFKANYSVPLKIGSGPLFESDSVDFSGGLALTPVSVMGKTSVSLTPVAFLNFSAGFNVATAWEAFGVKSISCYDEKKNEYCQQTAFETWYWQWWVSGTFMFDFAAIVPGDWHHVVMLASYELSRASLMNAKDDFVLYEFQTSENLINDFYMDSNLILGYQMPMKLSLVGIKAEVQGYLGDEKFSSYGGYCGDFKRISISPVMEYDFSDKNSLFMMVEFDSRRSFAEEHDETCKEPLLTQKGREWYFYRIAFSFTHRF